MGAVKGRTTPQPIIGIVPSFDEGVGAVGWNDEASRIFLRRDYLSTIARVGAVPVILSPDMELDQIAQLCDGIIISGGADIDPIHYGEEPIMPLMSLEPAERFAWESHLIALCDEANIPILGVCYGAQRLNVYYGGSLLQDIPTEMPSALDHADTHHHVVFAQDFLGVKEGSRRLVASRHHQAIGRVAEGIEVTAVADDGIIEAVSVHGRHFGLQWHPESDETGVHIYRAFVEHCSGVV